MSTVNGSSVTIFVHLHILSAHFSALFTIREGRKKRHAVSHAALFIACYFSADRNL